MRHETFLKKSEIVLVPVNPSQLLTKSRPDSDRPRCEFPHGFASDTKAAPAPAYSTLSVIAVEAV